MSSGDVSLNASLSLQSDISLSGICRSALETSTAMEVRDRLACRCQDRGEASCRRQLQFQRYLLPSGWHQADHCHII